MSKQRKRDVASGCCEIMAGQLGLICEDHPDLFDCPDAIVIRRPNGEFRAPIRDGGASAFTVNYCPWCGTDLRTNEKPLGA